VLDDFYNAEIYLRWSMCTYMYIHYVVLHAAQC